MFKKRAKEQEVMEMGQQTIEEEMTAEKSPLDEWGDTARPEVQAEERARKNFLKWKKKSDPDKEPLTPEQKKKRRKRLIIGGIVVVILALNIIPKLFAPEVLPQVSVSEAYLGTIEQTVEGSGSVKSEQVKTYFSPVSATIADFNLQVGDTVEAGEMLLTYDSAELDELYRQAELTGSAAGFGYQDAISRDNKNVSEFNRSSAALGTLEQQLEEEENENEHVRDRITEYTEKQAASSMELNNRQIELEDANIELRTAQAALEQLKKGTASNAGEEQALQNAIAAASAKRNNAQKRIEEEQKHLNEINDKLNSYNDRLKDSTERLEKLQTDKAKEQGIKDSTENSRLTSAARSELSTNNDLSSLNAQMTKDEIDQGRAGIQAEFSGVVTEITAVPGGPAAKGGNLFTIASNQEVIVDMSVTRFDLEKLEEGQSAEISLAGHTYTGTVSKLSRLAANNEKGTPVVSAQIHIDNPDENIYLGLEAKVAVNGRKAENVIVVPVEAVNTGVDGSFCYVMDEMGTVVKKDVETGLASAMDVEILSGLNVGDKVILNTAGMLVEEGMRVMAVEE